MVSIPNITKLAKGTLSDAFSQVRSHIPEAVKGRAPELLTGIGIAGFIFTTVEACRATPKALALREARDRSPDETRLQELAYDAKAMAPAYLRAGASGVASTACIIGGTVYSRRQYTVLAASASAMERAMALYEDKVVERLGAAEVDRIKTEVEEECPFDGGYIVDGSGNTLVYDHVTGHVFKTSREMILAAQGEVCSRLIDELYVPLGELYFRMGLDDDFKLARGVGFDTEVKPNIHFGSTLLPDGRVPKLSINYRTISLERIFD